LSLSWETQGKLFELFKWLLTFSLDSRPKLRKTAQSAVTNILKSSDNLDKTAYNSIGKFFINANTSPPSSTTRDNGLSKKNKKRTRGSGGNEEMEVEEREESTPGSLKLHLLAFLKSVLPLLPYRIQESVFTTSLLPTLQAAGETLEVVACFQVIESLFSEPRSKITLPSASSILSQLFSSLPFHPSDAHRGVAHARCLSRAIVRLCTLEIEAGEAEQEGKQHKKKGKSSSSSTSSAPSTSISAAFLPALFSGLLQMYKLEGHSRGEGHKASGPISEETTKLLKEVIQGGIGDDLILLSAEKSKSPPPFPLLFSFLILASCCFCFCFCFCFCSCSCSSSFFL
jgi:hypothetical protein